MAGSGVKAFRIDHPLDPENKYLLHYCAEGPEPLNVYTIDYMLFTNAKVKDDVVYKVIETLANNKPDLIAIAPHLGAFNPGLLYKKFNMTYHPGALKYFADHKMQPVEIK